MKRSLFTQIFGLFIVFSLLFSPIHFAWGDIFPSASEVAAELEKRYHLNLESIQNQGEFFNVSDQKKLSPEVMLFFSPSDPKPGEEITAQAYTMYFQNDRKDLYYTWYLKRPECDLDTTPSSEAERLCDLDQDGEITVEDWKIEAALIIANNTIDSSQITYDFDDDNDGYEATYGGNERKRTSARCYVADKTTGIMHELESRRPSSGRTSSTSSTSSGYNIVCPSGTTPKCLLTQERWCCDSPPCSADSYVPEERCMETQSEVTCLNKFANCINGEARCVPDTYDANPDSESCLGDDEHDENCFEEGPFFDSLQHNVLPVCEQDDSGGNNDNTVRVATSDGCLHLFPNVDNDNIPGETGDNTYGLSEERFWRTNPHDPDTSATGFGDEANIVGRGIERFTWNYQVGDQVGVAVEGTSQIPTKHDEHSHMIMWALSQNNCPVVGKGSYTKSIKGYDVQIPTAANNLNSCLERNLVDPREGGQKDNLNVTLSYSPEDPVNDSSGNDYGETVYISSSLENSDKEDSHIVYEWSVYISSDGTYNPREYSRENLDEETATWVDITQTLTDNQLLSFTKGNDLSLLALPLNITDTLLEEVGLNVDAVFPEELGNAGHLRVRLKVTEQFSAETYREGFSTVIIRINNSDARIVPSIAKVDETGTFITEPTGIDTICNDERTLRRGICYIAKNGVIALKLHESGYDALSWELDGKPLLCTSRVSEKECSDSEQTHVNFFPVTGEANTRHIVTVNVVEPETGLTKSFSRVFEIVDPSIEIISTDVDSVWPKYLGYYQTTDGKQFDDFSVDILQAYPEGTATLKALYFPEFLGTSSKTTKHWDVDMPLAEIQDVVEGDQRILTFPILESPGHSYMITLESFYKQDPAIREAMKKVWNLDITDTAEFWLEKNIQIELIQETEYEAVVIDSPQAFFASIASNTPQYLWFAIQTFLSVLVTVFGLSLLYSFSGRKHLYK